MFGSLFEQGLSLPAACLTWQPALLWLHAGSDIATAAAYFAVTVALAALVTKRRELLFGSTFWLFALFILGCGTIRLMDVWVLWHPDDGVQGMAKACTAVASVLTAIVLCRILPKVLVLPTLAQFRDVSDQLTNATIRHEYTAEQLHRTEESFQFLVESVRDCAMFILDPNGNVISWNAGAQNIKQYEAAEILGRHFSCFYTAADRAAEKPMHALEIAAQSGTYQEEGWRIRRDGTPFIAEVLINPIRSRNGVLVGYAKVTREITQRKQAEKDLEQARAALAQSQKMEAVGQLTGGIAHDFNNMLTAILGSLELLEIRRGEFTHDATRMLQVIRHAADHGAELTRRLLAFSRKQSLAPALTDLNRLVSAMSELLRRTLGEAVTVETVMAGGLPAAYVDPNQVESALLNLAVNARDAMPRGGRLTIETGNAFLDDDCLRRQAGVAAGDYLFIAVSDSGTGMTADVLAHAFEPFYTTKEVGRGTGLGLSQVYGFVKQSGGHVELYSEVGHGTTVKMYFPRPQTQPPAMAETETTAEPIPRGTETILVVENDEDVLSYSANAARHLGYNVLEATDAATAFAILDARPDVGLVFTDIGLPDVNGRELANRARARRPGVKIVFTSGYARTAVTNLGLLDRGMPFLPKPFRIESLARMLRSAFEMA